MLPIKEVFAGKDQEYEKYKSKIGFGIHVCLPCIVQSYNVEQNTVDVQPAIRERIVLETGEIKYIDYPLLINVPVVDYSSGNYLIHLPITQGDECLVIFSDLAIDNWWVSGGIQNPLEQRRHDLSDGFALFGVKNQKENIIPKWGFKKNQLSIVDRANGCGLTVSDKSTGSYEGETEGGRIYAMVGHLYDAHVEIERSYVTFYDIINNLGGGIVDQEGD